MNKHIWKIDLIIVAVSVLILMGLVGYARPLVIAPLDGYKSIDGEVLFEFEGAPLDSLLHQTGQAPVLLIDDNADFTTPSEYKIVDGKRVSLSPGVYYWKVSGVLGSEVRKLTIQSSVELKLVELKEGFGVVNVGNVRLNVDVYDGENLVEKMKLGIGGVSGEGNKFVGEMDG